MFGGRASRESTKDGRGDERLVQPAPPRRLGRVFVDAIMVKVRDGQVANRPIYAAIAVSLAREKGVLGLSAGTGGERAKFWMAVLTDLRNRDVNDVFFPVCDGLKSLPQVVSSVWPLSTVLRSSSRCGRGGTGLQRQFTPAAGGRGSRLALRCAESHAVEGEGSRSYRSSCTWRRRCGPRWSGSTDPTGSGDVRRAFGSRGQATEALEPELVDRSQ
jgi:hypothetical protein